MTAKSGASLACATWPSCNGELLPDLADGGVRIHFAHRVLAALTAVLLLALLVRVRRTPGLPADVHRLALVAAGLVVVQVGFGALVILLEAPVWKAVLHQATGVLTFATVTLLMWRCLPLGRRANRNVVGDSDGLALRGA